MLFEKDTSNIQFYKNIISILINNSIEFYIKDKKNFYSFFYTNIINHYNITASPGWQFILIKYSKSVFRKYKKIPIAIKIKNGHYLQILREHAYGPHLVPSNEFLTTEKFFNKTFNIKHLTEESKNELEKKCFYVI